MAEKMKMVTGDILGENIDYIKRRFPAAVVEVVENGKTTSRIDFEILKQELTNDVLEEGNERYQIQWPGRKRSILLANSPTTSTLLPQMEKSIEFENTKNIYIEGDNLEVLKVIRETYLGKIKMIYIDPPYNTGNDFIYDDDYSQSSTDFVSVTGQIDESGNRLVKNLETDGRFHTNWLNMIYPRLRVARDLLRDDGVIFISIDDKEVANLIRVCNDVFGEHNFVSNIIWQSRTSISNDYEVSTNHNHTLIYSKNREALVFGGEPIDASDYINPDNDPRGPWKLVPLDANHAGGDTIYPIRNPKTGVDYYPPNGRIWCYNRQGMQRLLDDGRIKFGLNDDSAPKRKLYYNERLENGDKKTPSSILLDAGTTKDGTNEIMDLFGGTKVFDYPKPVTLIKRLIRYGAPEGGIILDFFSGSGTTAQAVMEYAQETGIDLSYILVQLPENLDESLKKAAPEAKKTISNAIQMLDSLSKKHLLTEIAEERIFRARKKILSKNSLISNGFDSGLRVFKLDSTNMKAVYYNPRRAQQSLLSEDVSNIKADRDSMDLLFQVMLELGVELSAKIDSVFINGKKILTVNENFIVACFDEAVDEAVIQRIAELKPVYVVFRDASFKNDSANINCEQLIKAISPSTELKVL